MKLQRVILTVAFVIVTFITGWIFLKFNKKEAPAQSDKAVFRNASFTLDTTPSTYTISSIFFREDNQGTPLADSIINYAKSLIGTPYHFTGKCVQSGFDCSGFTHHVYEKFGIELTPGSNSQALAGKKVPVSAVKRGDLLVFTGTNLKVRKPGHVGIAITRQGERPVKFIHSSSNGGVKISQVDSTTYAKRLLQVRRLIN